MSLRGKRILVTGGSSGIGQATALRVAADGARTAVVDINEGAEPTTMEQIRAAGGETRYWRADIAMESDVSTAVDEATEWLGGIDAVLHCAGIMKGQGLDIRDFGVDTWLEVLAVNLTGSFFVAKHAARHMIPAAQGVLVLVASVGGVTGGSGSYAYGASKGGMMGLGLSLDARLAPYGIRVHVVCPAAIDTPLFRASVREGLANGSDPARFETDLGSPAGVANVMALLVSDAAAYLPLAIVARPRVEFEEATVVPG